jgi:protein disulfide-isomerase-like protein
MFNTRMLNENSYLLLSCSSTAILVIFLSMNVQFCNQHATKNMNNNAIVFFILLIITIAFATGEDLAGKPSKHVVTLDSNNFDDFVLKGDDKNPNYWFIKFYAPWCGHCQHLAPTWNDLGEQLENTNVQVGKVDCTKENDICNKYHVRGYPSLFFFKDGEMVADYEKARSINALQNYVERMTNAPKFDGDVVELSQANFESTISENPNALWFVKFYSPECSACQSMGQSWIDFAKEMKSSNVMVAEVNCLVENDLCQKYSISRYPTLILIKNTKKVEYTGSRSVESYSEFAKEGYKKSQFSARKLLDKGEDGFIDVVVQLMQENPGIFFGLVILIIVVLILCVIMIICLTDAYGAEPVNRKSKSTKSATTTTTSIEENSTTSSSFIPSSIGSEIRERPAKAKDY